MEFVLGSKYDILVKTQQREQGIFFENDVLVVRVKSQAIENKANEEILKLFKKELSLNIRIVSGLKNKKKIIQILS